MLPLPGSHLAAPFIYGTAWKKEQTATLVYRALAAGFRAIDTAALPKHYQEHLVGDGVREAIRAGIVTRRELHIQTKFTPPGGQDLRNLPYDVASSVESQVKASVESSLRNLHVADAGGDASDYIDCLILHSPLSTFEKTLEAWQAMSTFVGGQVRSLGISNVNLEVLRLIYSQSDIIPAVVQNRFYRATKYDHSIREFCRDKGIVYQSFWTLTGNPNLKTSKIVSEVSQSIGVDRELALYALVNAMDITILNGTTNAETMSKDLAGIGQVEDFKSKTDNKSVWDQWVKEFERNLIM